MCFVFVNANYSQFWTNVDLINRMLAVNPADRITLDEVLAHPWIQGPVLSGMELFQAMHHRAQEMRWKKILEEAGSRGQGQGVVAATATSAHTDEMASKYPPVTPEQNGSQTAQKITISGTAIQPAVNTGKPSGNAKAKIKMASLAIDTSRIMHEVSSHVVTPRMDEEEERGQGNGKRDRELMMKTIMKSVVGGIGASTGFKRAASDAGLDDN